MTCKTVPVKTRDRIVISRQTVLMLCKCCVNTVHLSHAVSEDVLMAEVRNEDA